MQKFDLVGDYLRHWAQETPNAEALVWGDRRIAYADYLAAVEGLAAYLHALGVRRGDRIAILAPPRPEAMLVFLAAAELGAIYMGLNAKGTLGEYETAIIDASPKVLIATLSHLTRDYRNDLSTLRSKLNIPHLITIDGKLDPATPDFETAIATPPMQDLSRPAANAPVVMVYTSGSTGKAKGALITHSSMIAGIGAQALRFAKAQPSRAMFVTALHVLGSIGNSGLSQLMLGGALIFMDNYSPREALALMAREKVTIWAQVPTMFLMQLSLPEFRRTDLSNVQCIFFAGSAMPLEAIDQLEHLGADLVTGYGLTETSGPTTLSVRGTSTPELSATIGRPVAGVEVGVVNDEGDAVRRGDVGEFWFRGASIFAGYFNDPRASTEAITADGWFKSGDLGFEDETGALRMTGRKQEAFKSGGANVFPREVEEALQSHPSVMLACVTPVPDPVYQEVGYAFLIPTEFHIIDVEELRRWCAAKLSKYKVPRHFEVREKFPTLPLGKIDRVALKREALAATSA